MARVLVVDDAAFMRKLLTDALVSGGHEVVGEAGNGIEAVARWQELRPELTTLDITMPEKDGLAALAEIMAIDPSAKIIMCSALGQEGKVLEAVKLGAKDFVVKPFQPPRVLEAVERRSAEPFARRARQTRRASGRGRCGLRTLAASKESRASGRLVGMTPLPWVSLDEAAHVHTWRPLCVRPYHHAVCRLRSGSRRRALRSSFDNKYGAEQDAER